MLSNNLFNQLFFTGLISQSWAVRRNVGTLG